MKLFGNGHHGGAHEQTPQIEVTEIRSDAAETPEAPSIPPKKKSRRWIYVLGAVVLVLAAALTAYAIWERPPEIAPPKAPGAEVPAVQQTPAPGADDPSGTTPDDPFPETEEPELAFSSEHKDGVYSMLVVGRDWASNSTDTILLACFDTVQHTINVVNIPRDTLINLSWSNTPKKINTVFPGYINSGKDGLEGLRQHVKNLLGFDVDCYAVVTLLAVERAVDAIGGIYFDVPQDMDYDDAPQYFHVHLKKGYQLLSGYETLGVFRYRHGYLNGDLDRIKVQQDLMKAIASQMLSLGNIPNLGEVINILVESVDTNLSAANIAWFARQFLQCNMDNISFSTIPSSNTCLIGGISYVSIDVPAWLKMVNEQLNPYQDEVTVSNVNILTSNYSGSSMNSTTGQIAGGYDSFYCQTCTINNGGTAVHHAPGACPAEETEPETGEIAEETDPAEEIDPAEGTEPAETPEIEVVVVPPVAETPGESEES